MIENSIFTTTVKLRPSYRRPDAENHLCGSEELVLPLQKRKRSECEKPNLHYWSTVKVEENHGNLRFKLLLQICTYEKLSHGNTGNKELGLFGRLPLQLDQIRSVINCCF